MPKKIAAFGELLWDLSSFREEFWAELQQTFIYRINSFRRLPVRFLSKVGNDKAGKDIRENRLNDSGGFRRKHSNRLRISNRFGKSKG